jgi:hypothetical protein
MGAMLPSQFWRVAGGGENLRVILRGVAYRDGGRNRPTSTPRVSSQHQRVQRGTQGALELRAAWYRSYHCSRLHSWITHPLMYATRTDRCPSAAPSLHENAGLVHSLSRPGPLARIGQSQYSSIGCCGGGGNAPRGHPLGKSGSKLSTRFAGTRSKVGLATIGCPAR